METVSIKVSLETAKGWLNVPKARRNQLEKQFKEQIEKEIRMAKNKHLSDAMDNLSAEAAKNGLTPEILEEILNSDD